MFMRAKLEKKHENGLKKHSIFEKLGSFYDLFRTFGFAEGTVAREIKRKRTFLLIFAHLFVPLHRLRRFEQSPPNGDAADSELARLSTYGAQEAKGA